MFKAGPEDHRELRTERVDAELAIIGGGIAGVCCAITAARAGLRVVLIQDRPVLGGNASSEVRLWILGATSHMGNNNRWAREGGVLDELLVENTWRNPEGNPIFLDALLLEKVAAEANIRLLLNTAALAVEKEGDRIAAVRAFCPQNSQLYHVAAPLFCDASGDGIVGYLAGAAYRVGAEAAGEFDEGFAPSAEYGELLGHTLYFYSKDAGRPIHYVPPAFALADISKIPRFRSFNAKDYGCRLWWIEYGGRLDTVHDTEAIKWELWKVAYGVWNYIKNSGNFPEAENLTLEWIGTIPGKRESRRFEGDYILSQRDVVEQRPHADAVGFGGWAIDLHPADGVFSEKPGCSQWHSKGVYQIPYRCLYSRNVPNLFLAGRIISVSHVAFGSTRVMATCGHNAQVVALAAVACLKHGLLPADLNQPERMAALQTALLRSGQHIPGLRRVERADLAQRAIVTASSELRLAELPADGDSLSLENSWAALLPLSADMPPTLGISVDVRRATTLVGELRISSKAANHTPDVLVDRREWRVPAGDNQSLQLRFDGPRAGRLDGPCYAFFCLMSNADVAVRTSDWRLTGVLAVAHQMNAAVAKSARQEPPPGAGIDSFEFWTPRRRPEGKNLALRIDPPLECFGPANVVNGVGRPTVAPNAWVADPADPRPTLVLRWPQTESIARVELVFDTDFDHPMESVLMGHPERVMPCCVRRAWIRDAEGRLLYEIVDNHQTRQICRLDPPCRTTALSVEVEHPAGNAPAAVLEVRCYAPSKLTTETQP